MATVSEHLGAIRTLIRNTSDDSTYKNPFLYHLLNSARGLLLFHELQKKSKLNEWNYQSFCLKMELSTFSDCTCVPNTQCQVLKSIVDIPAPISGKYTSILKVTTIDGYPELYRSSPLKEKLGRRSKTKDSKLGWDIINNKLVIFIKDKMIPPKVVRIFGVFEDPLSLSNITACTDSGEELPTGCFNIETSEYPLEAKFNAPAYDMVLKQLGFSLSIPDDKVNDGQA